MAVTEHLTPVDNHDSGQKAADDWLAAFAKKSEEALAARAKEKQIAPAPKNQEAIVVALARKPLTEYDAVRSEVADALGIRKGTLDLRVDEARTKLGESSVSGVIFPCFEPVSFPVDGAALFDSVASRIQRHIVASEEAITVAALWIGFAWTHDAWIHSPILLVSSKEPNSGKTTLVELVKFLAPRGLSAVDMTGPVVYRFIERFHPTFVVDEADVAFRENEQLRSVFNSGWTRGSGVPRINPDTMEPEIFSTFGPKVVGMKGLKLPDTTLGRSIVLEMKRKLPREKVQDFEHLDDAELRVHRDQLARWSIDALEGLRGSRPQMPDGFHNRLAANWRPLLAIADLIGGDWPSRVRTAAKALGTRDASTIFAKTLAAIHVMFEGRDRILSADIVQALHEIEGGPWAEWGKAGKPITQNALARLLSPVAPGNIRVGDRVARGYERRQFEDLFERYLDPEPDPSPVTPPSQPLHRNKCDEIRTSEISQPLHPETDVAVAKSEKVNNGGVCSGVAVEKGEREEKKRAEVPLPHLGSAPSATPATSRSTRFPAPTSGCTASAGGSGSKTIRSQPARATAAHLLTSYAARRRPTGGPAPMATASMTSNDQGATCNDDR